MARGTTLGEMINMLRVEARLDPNPALSLNMVAMMTETLKRTQERLYDEFDWPFLKITRDVDGQAGSRYYDVPIDMNLERISRVDYKWSDKWYPLDRGITLDHYNRHDSDNPAVRADPAQCWDVKDTGSGEQIEIWPIPATNGIPIRFSGIRKLTPLIANSDRADLDDKIIVLYSAGEILGGSGNQLAEAKLAMAKERTETLQGRASKRTNNSFTLGGCDPSAQPEDWRTPRVAYVRNP